MARIRTYKPDFLRHELLQDLETKNPGKYPMFVFLGLWSVCDKQGVFPWKPRSLKLDIYPFLDFDMEETLQILIDAGFIRRFIGKEDEETYGHVINFEKHQRISGDEAKNPSKYPPPNEESIEKHGRSKVEAQKKEERSSQESGKGKEREREREKEKERRDDFSFSEGLNQKLSDFSERLEKLRENYNTLKIGPPFKKMAITLNPAESSDLMKIMQVYPDDISIKAMENYAQIKKSPEYDPGGCVYHGFVSFMVRGVEKYCDEARPFETFRKKTSGPSPPKNKHWDHDFDISRPKEVI
jgi:hypothetical protein